jgi:hypothetical protein
MAQEAVTSVLAYQGGGGGTDCGRISEIVSAIPDLTSDDSIAMKGAAKSVTINIQI